MFFILLSIASFVLRTLPAFEIAEFTLMNVTTGYNRTEQAIVSNTQQRQIISAFDTIEWFCKSNEKRERL